MLWFILTSFWAILKFFSILKKKSNGMYSGRFPHNLKAASKTIRWCQHFQKIRVCVSGWGYSMKLWQLTLLKFYIIGGVCCCFCDICLISKYCYLLAWHIWFPISEGWTGFKLRFWNKQSFLLQHWTESWFYKYPM